METKEIMGLNEALRLRIGDLVKVRKTGKVMRLADIVSVAAHETTNGIAGASLKVGNGGRYGYKQVQAAAEGTAPDYGQ